MEEDTAFKTCGKERKLRIPAVSAAPWRWQVVSQELGDNRRKCELIERDNTDSVHI